MKCRVCGKEIDEGSEFCKFCGASQKQKRKLTWGEKKRQREKETQEIIRKSYLTEQDIALAEKADVSGLELRALGDIKTAEKKAIGFCVLYAFVTLCALGALVLFQYLTGVDRTLRAILSFVALLILAGFGASFADRLYSARIFAKMAKNDRAVKKIFYGKAPYVNNHGKLYQLICTGLCNKCGMTRHIEEYDGKLVIVCDADRMHLGIIDTKDIFSVLLGEDVEKDGDAEKVADDQKADDKENVEDKEAAQENTRQSSDDKD